MPSSANKLKRNSGLCGTIIKDLTFVPSESQEDRRKRKELKKHSKK